MGLGRLSSRLTSRFTARLTSRARLPFSLVDLCDVLYMLDPESGTIRSRYVTVGVGFKTSS